MDGGNSLFSMGNRRNQAHYTEKLAQDEAWEWAGSSPTSLGGPAKSNEEAAQTWVAVAAAGSCFTAVCASSPAKHVS